jgi:hypothetical protein
VDEVRLLLSARAASEKGRLFGLMPEEGATRAPEIAQPVTPEKIVKGLKEKGKWMK